MQLHRQILETLPGIYAKPVARQAAGITQTRHDYLDHEGVLVAQQRIKGARLNYFCTGQDDA